MRIPCAIAVVSLFLLPAGASSRILRVPSECPTIQSGVDSAAIGDTVLVAPGDYREWVYVDHGVVLRSEAGAEVTSIGNSTALMAGPIVECWVDPGWVPGAFVIDGFTVQGGFGYPGCGGGISALRANIVIRDCIFKRFYVTDAGSAIGLNGCNADVIGNIIIDDLGLGEYAPAVFFGVHDGVFASNTVCGGGVATWHSPVLA